MSSRKGVFANIAIFAVIIVGYAAFAISTARTQPRMLSYENTGLAALKGYQGRNLLIHFGADGCATDRRAFARLAALPIAARLHPLDIGSPRMAAPLGGLDPAAFEPSGDLALAMGVRTRPQTLLIDARGAVVAQIEGPLGEAESRALERKIAGLASGPESFGHVPGFVLQSSAGRPVTRAALDDKIWVADFIFTSCPGLCPMLSAKMRALQDEFKGQRRFKLVSISIDPETDTPKRLSSYGKRFGAEPDTWYFLTGRQDAVNSLLLGGFKLGTAEKPEFHTAKLVLVDPAGTIRGYYDADSGESFGKLRADIAGLLRTSSPTTHTSL